MNTHNYQLNPFCISQLINLTRFIVTENAKHHGHDEETKSPSSITSIVKTETNLFKNAFYYVYRNQAEDIVGSIRLVRWNYIDELPIQRIFSINPLEFLAKTNEPIWHIGSFATKKGTTNLSLFKKLILHAISPICIMKQGVAFAECDRKLFRVMHAMGIKARIIGSSRYYLGSETIPISMNYNDLIYFYNRNKNLLEAQGQINHNINENAVAYKPVA